jgi:hypothetical protein
LTFKTVYHRVPGDEGFAERVRDWVMKGITVRRRRHGVSLGEIEGRKD